MKITFLFYLMKCNISTTLQKNVYFFTHWFEMTLYNIYKVSIYRLVTKYLGTYVLS